MISGGASRRRVVPASVVSTVSPVKPNDADLLSRSRYSLDRVNTWSMFSGPRARSMRIVLSSCTDQPSQGHAFRKYTDLFVVGIA